MLYTLDGIDRQPPAIQPAQSAARYAFDLFASLAAIAVLAPLATFAVLSASWRAQLPTDQLDE